MSDLAITAANVVVASPSTTNNGVAGATITAGQTVYLSPTTGDYLPAKANNVNTTTVAGIALNNAAAGQPLQILTSGNYVCGGTPVVGGTYMLSAANAGGIAPVDDIVTTDYVSFLGIATSNTNIFIQILNSGTIHA